MYELVAGLLGNELLVAVALGMTPFSELGGASLYAFAVGKPWLIAPAALANFLVVPLLLVLWDRFRIREIGMRIAGRRVDRKLREFNEKHQSLGLYGIAVFIGVPGPGTGVYMGTLLSQILGIKRRQQLLGAAAGIALTGLIMFVSLSGLVSLRLW
jgi:uncharacterized membrane protein